MTQIFLRNVRKSIDEKYVGFPFNGSSIKPVHIAGGSLRCIFGKYNKTMKIKRMALVSNAQGVTPNGNTDNEIFTLLKSNEEIEDDISENSISSLRNIMQKLLSVDKGVYITKALKDGMISYSAGSKYFLTAHAMYEDGGEFIGSIIRKHCPDLANYIKEILKKARDPITLLFEPVLEDNFILSEYPMPHENIPAFMHPNKHVEWFCNGIKNSGLSLLDNFKNIQNPLMILRLFNLFCIFQLFRYSSLLAAFYCNEQIRPILLDFSRTRSGIAKASEMSYIQICNSINRFYAQEYSNWLKENNFTKNILLQSDTPVYEEKNNVKKNTKEELNTLWNIAKEKAKEVPENEALLIFGETIYDMLALEASSYPIIYLKTLGSSTGILYPPDKLHPNKRFAPSQDVLEMLLRCCVCYTETIRGAEIRERLWERFGIIIGQGDLEAEKLQSVGMILPIDEDALENNFSAFAHKLESLDFAEIMADGILQIRLGGTDR